MRCYGRESSHMSKMISFLKNFLLFTIGSPSERCGLLLNDEIIEVNGFNVERASHHEIIVQIHNSKKKIVLTVKRTKNVLSNGK